MTKTSRYVVVGGRRISEEMYRALRPIYRLCEKLSGERTFALTEVVKENRAGRSYAVYRRSRPTRAIVKFGIKADTGQREDFTRLMSPELRAKIAEFRDVFANRSS